MFTKEEVTSALKGLPSAKSPGIDGFPAEFFQHYWEVISEDITAAVLSSSPLGNYSKVLTTRLKLVVDSIVGPSQSAFIEGRSILDNVVVAHEIVKSYSYKNVSPRCLIKIDIRKAYDSVEWSFLQMVLHEFGFPIKIVSLIMECVTIVQYSLILNGGLTPQFQAKKGLRQGDLMSPADHGSIQLMLQAFTHFSQVSGLHANLEKSSIYLAGVSQMFKDQIINDMEFVVGEIPFRYLGVPLSSKKLSIQQCMPLAQVFLLLKKITELVTSVCRTFLWTGAAELWRKALVAWERLKKTLRVQWIHSFYIKAQSIDAMLRPKQASWIVRKIIDARDWFDTDDILTELTKFCQNGKFNIKLAYQSFLPQCPKVQWKSITMGNGIIPRQQFITWLAIQHRLATVDRLAKWGIQVAKHCVLCDLGTKETLAHFFFDCRYCSNIWSALLRWLGITRHSTSWYIEIAWLSQRVKSARPKAEILRFLFNATIYHVWLERNARRFQTT
ncbi:uncharacterized protein LOC132611538 [Lycium barbarum]|uniref:uncharacterized protein LOC132611538 n=1 Tax=Lycium barbarum TaxID=112863 RepID=UPI00293EF488|nr:uncharacterized protein LOC132611538 [Lycium barbarum]